jgi:hypothetical protein
MKLLSASVHRRKQPCRRRRCIYTGRARHKSAWHTRNHVTHVSSCLVTEVRRGGECDDEYDVISQEYIHNGRAQQHTFKGKKARLGWTEAVVYSCLVFKGDFGLWFLMHDVPGRLGGSASLHVTSISMTYYRTGCFENDASCYFYQYISFKSWQKYFSKASIHLFFGSTEFKGVFVYINNTTEWKPDSINLTIFLHSEK